MSVLVSWFQIVPPASFACLARKWKPPKTQEELAAEKDKKENRKRAKKEESKKKEVKSESEERDSDGGEKKTLSVHSCTAHIYIHIYIYIYCIPTRSTCLLNFICFSCRSLDLNRPRLEWCSRL